MLMYYPEFATARDENVVVSIDFSVGAKVWRAARVRLHGGLAAIFLIY